jgi:hypothetical protein
MSYFFPDHIRTELKNTPTLLTSKQIKVVLLEEAPIFESEDVRFQSVTTLASLLAFPGWRQAGTQPTGTISSGTPYIFGKNHYILFPSIYPFTGITGQVLTKAFAFLLVGTYGGVVDPVLYVSTSPFPERRVLQATDGITSNPDVGLLVGAPPPSTNRWLLTWADNSDASATMQTVMLEGPIAVSQAAPPFEVSHSQHIWLYPQRANMIANPSFEGNTNYWSSNGTISKVSGGAPAGWSPSVWSGQFAGAGTIVAESNTFLTSYQENWTIQLRIKGSGSCKVGFVFWEDDFAETAVDWGTETFTLSPTSWLRIGVCRHAPQAYQGMVRIESNGGTFTIDQVLCEAGFLKDWPYFDGDATYGARGDFSWQGGAARQGNAYSLWYNNKTLLYSFLFARKIDDATIITDAVLKEQGYVYQWVPAGTFIVTHMDTLYPNDLGPSGTALPAKPSGVIAYRSGVLPPTTADLIKISTPW